MRLAVAKNAFPSYLVSQRTQLDDIVAIINSINQEFQNSIGDAIEKIDYDQFESHKLFTIRLQK